MDARTIRNARMLIEEGARQLRPPSAVADDEADCSILAALAQLIENPHVGATGSRATPEARASNRVAERLDRAPAPGCMFVPVRTAARDMTVGTASAGGHLVGTSVAPGDTFTAALRAHSITAALGVREIALERVNATLPNVTGDISAYWLTNEGTGITEGGLTFAVGTATPKTVGAYFEASGQLIKQITPAGEAFVLNELGRAVAAAVDAALINGSGSNGEPTGILGTSGIGAQSGASVDWDAIADTIGDVEAANGAVSADAIGWAVAPDAAKILRKRDAATAAGRFLLANGQIDGRRAVVSNSIPSATALFGDWSGVALVTWGALEIGIMRADAGSTLFSRGLVGVRCMWSLDVAVLRPPSFCKLTSIS